MATTNYGRRVSAFAVQLVLWLASHHVVASAQDSARDGASLRIAAPRLMLSGVANVEDLGTLAHGSAPAAHTPRAMSQLPLRHRTSPLLWWGIGLGAGSYVVSLGVGVIYLVLIYPLQAAFSDNDKAEPLALWMLVPVAGPFIAQRQKLVRDEQGWRAVLISDGVLQGAGLALIIAGIALSGQLPTDPMEQSKLQVLPGAASSPLGLTLRARLF